MNDSEILVLLAEHHEALTAALNEGLDDDGAFPVGPDLDGVELQAGDYDKAVAVLADLSALQIRVSGLQTRIAGELAGMRRTRSTASKPAPRAFDTSL